MAPLPADRRYAKLVRMAARKSVTKRAAKQPPAPKAAIPLDQRAALAALAKYARKDAGLERFGIVTKDRVLGVGMKDIQAVGKLIGRNHALAQSLWQSGVYEARMLAAYVASPARVTPTEMDRWAKDFDNWAVCDTMCFALWDQTPHAWGKVAKWSQARDEFVKRAGFALLASMALHDKKGEDRPYLDALALIERESGDERNFVKKAVLWALRGIGNRNAGCKRAATAMAKQLAADEDRTSRWIGKTALREMAKR